MRSRCGLIIAVQIEGLKSRCPKEAEIAAQSSVPREREEELRRIATVNRCAIRRATSNDTALAKPAERSPRATSIGIDWCP